MNQQGPLHWPEYLMEAGAIAAFMLSAASFATLLQHPASPLASLAASPLLQRAAMGAAMGTTLIAIVYSPWGLRSGAHMNPALTLAFLRLGRVAPRDAAGYMAAQFTGGALGIVLASALLAWLPADPSVNYVATVPGPRGVIAALLAETAISFGMMLAVLEMSSGRAQHLTGVLAGLLVAIYIVLEAPLSGMSMNPARSLGPALLAGTLDSVWIYFVAPAAGMQLAAVVFVRLRRRVRCAKVVHRPGVGCIFRCGHDLPAREAA